MTNRVFVGFFLLFWVTGIAHAQMSDDEALPRLKERQTARVAEPRAVPATQPAQLASASKVADLSAQVHALDVEIIRRFSGAIGAMWTPAQTQEWLDKAANSAAAAPHTLINLEANAKIIVAAAMPERFEIIGHLFPVGQRLALTNADKLDMKPAQTRADTAAGVLAKLQFQYDDAVRQPGWITFQHIVCAVPPSGRAGFFSPILLAVISVRVMVIQTVRVPWSAPFVCAASRSSPR